MPEQNNYYNKSLKPFASQNRKSGNKAEIRVWCEVLRNKQMMGFGFLRQRVVGNYIVDFFCKDLNLVIEIDGYSHTLDDVYEKDVVRTTYLESAGFSVLRFTNDDIMNNVDAVRNAISGWIRTNHPPAPFEGGQSTRKKKSNDDIEFYNENTDV